MYISSAACKPVKNANISHLRLWIFTSKSLWWLTCVPSPLPVPDMLPNTTPRKQMNGWFTWKITVFFLQKKKKNIMSTKPSLLCVPYQTAWIGTAGHLISFRLENHPPARQSDISRANDPRNKFYPWVGFQGMCIGNHKDKYEIYKNRVHIYVYIYVCVNIYSVY